jgi:hypothetical protein
MTERLAAAGTGLPTVLVGERFLHSRYDPLGEGEKYIKTLNLSGKIRFFILIEPGLGYSIPALRRLFSPAKIIALHVSDFFAKSPGETPENTVSWSPGTGLPLGEFLEQEIPDTGIETIKIIEWRPALAAYGTAYKDLLEGAVTFIRRAAANARTVRGFGRRWFRNFFRNLGIIRRYVSITTGSGPWIITGAGPGLEETLLVIREMQREGATVLAAASSVSALAEGCILPNLVIATDGGGWARYHLYETLRSVSGRLLLFAVSLTAALPCQCDRFPLLLLSDGSLWQETVLGKLGIPHLIFPQRGTVTASALDLALYGTRGAVYFAGIDLSHDDIKTHARPYAFDRFAEEGATRLEPRYSRAFVRSNLIAASESHRVYAEWFESRLDAYPGRIHSLGKNHPVFDRFRASRGPEKRRLAGPLVSLVGRARIDSSEAARFLAGFPDESGPALCRELGPLLLPDEENITPDRLRREIIALTIGKETWEEIANG